MRRHCPGRVRVLSLQSSGTWKRLLLLVLPGFLWFSNVRVPAKRILLFQEFVASSCKKTGVGMCLRRILLSHSVPPETVVQFVLGGINAPGAFRGRCIAKCESRGRCAYPLARLNINTEVKRAMSWRSFCVSMLVCRSVSNIFFLVI